MKLFELNFAQMLVRYYLMMLIIIAAGFSGQWWLAGLAFFVFLSAIMGMKFSKEKAAKQSTGKMVQMDATSQMRKAS